MSWLHRLFSPEFCETCEVLKQQLSLSQQREERLLNRLLNPISLPDASDLIKDPELITPKHIPWSVKRQMLEEEDRAKARVIREQSSKIQEDIKDLETELGLESLKMGNENAS